MHQPRRRLNDAGHMVCESLTRTEWWCGTFLWFHGAAAGGGGAAGGLGFGSAGLPLIILSRLKPANGAMTQLTAADLRSNALQHTYSRYNLADVFAVYRYRCTMQRYRDSAPIGSLERNIQLINIQAKSICIHFSARDPFSYACL